MLGSPRPPVKDHRDRGPAGAEKTPVDAGDRGSRRESFTPREGASSLAAEVGQDGEDAAVAAVLG
ncbi:hypothetical protein GCM10010149_56610 [Nonomuraea roseoviolacea subsp. roseoviolacea]